MESANNDAVSLPPPSPTTLSVGHFFLFFAFLHSSTLLRLAAAYPHAPLCPLLQPLHSQRAILFTFTTRTSGHCLETLRALRFPVPRNNNNSDDEGTHHTKAGTNRLYIERQIGGRRLVELESARNAAIIGLSECIVAHHNRVRM